MTLYQATYGKLVTLKAEIAGIERTLNSDTVILNEQIIRQHLCDLRAILRQREGR